MCKSNTDMSTSPLPDVLLNTLTPSRNSGESENSKYSPGQLYSSLPLAPGWAREVYIWLGPGDERSERAITYLERMSSVRVGSVATPWTDGRSTKSVAGDTLRSVLNMTLVLCRSYYQC